MDVKILCLVSESELTMALKAMEESSNFYIKFKEVLVKVKILSSCSGHVWFVFLAAGHIFKFLAYHHDNIRREISPSSLPLRAG